MGRLTAIFTVLSMLAVYLTLDSGTAEEVRPAQLTCSSPEIREITKKTLPEPTIERGNAHNGMLGCQTRDTLTYWVFSLNGSTVSSYKVYRYVPYTNIKTLDGPERAIPGDRSLDGKTCADPDVRPITSLLPDAGEVVDLGIVDLAGAHLLVCRATSEYAFWVFWREQDGGLGYQLGGTLFRWDRKSDGAVRIDDTALPVPCSNPDQAALFRDKFNLSNIIDLGVHLSSIGDGTARYCTDIIKALTFELYSGPASKSHFKMYGIDRVSWHDHMEYVEKHGETFEIDSSEHAR
jgi:hypothetical protein